MDILLDTDTCTAYRPSQRVVLLEGWKEFEQEHGSQADIDKVQAMMPIVSRKRRKVDELGDTMEECKSTRCVLWSLILTRSC